MDTHEQRQQLYYCIPCINDSTNHLIYILDLYPLLKNPVDRSSDGGLLTTLAPTLRVGPAACLDVYAFCVSGSTLYLFQDSLNKLGTRPNPEATSVATLDLSDYLTRSNVNLEKHMLSYAAPMHHPKTFPNAITTPDGEQILVFSPRITCGPTTEGANFEMYDLKTDTWCQLPDIHAADAAKNRDGFFGISSSAFTDDHTLLIHSDFGFYTLDLVEQNWRKLNINTDCGLASVGFLAAIDGGVCFGDFGAYDIDLDIGDRSCICNYPATVGPAVWKYESRHRWEVGTTCQLCDGDFFFCRVWTATDRETRCPLLGLEIYRCDLAKYREDKKKMEIGSAKLTISLCNAPTFFLMNDLKPGFLFSPCRVYALQFSS